MKIRFGIPVYFVVLSLRPCQAPPQLWRLESVKETVRLSLRHTYMPKVSVDFAGPSYFGGKSDQLVLCAGKGKLFTPFRYGRNIGLDD